MSIVIAKRTALRNPPCSAEARVGMLSGAREGWNAIRHSYANAARESRQMREPHSSTTRPVRASPAAWRCWIASFSGLESGLLSVFVSKVAGIYM